MSQIVQRVRQNPLLLGAIVIIGLLGLVVAWWLGSPLFINNKVEEAFPVSGQQTTQQTAVAITPISVASGSFRDGDSFHKGSGKAGIYQVDGGTFVLRFEDFNVTNGPDLHVYLVKNTDPVTSGDVNDGGYLDLGSIKGNQGAQNYPIPVGTDLSQYHSVVIYCQPFHVVFSVASLVTP